MSILPLRRRGQGFEFLRARQLFQLTSRPCSVVSKCWWMHHPIPTQIATAPPPCPKIT